MAARAAVCVVVALAVALGVAGAVAGWAEPGMLRRRHDAASDFVCNYGSIAAERGVLLGRDDTPLLRELLEGGCLARARAHNKSRGVVLLPGYYPCTALSCPVSDDGAAGLYFSGALNLTSHTTLRVEWPARLLALPNVSLYHWPWVQYRDPATDVWNCGHMPHESACTCGSKTCGFNMAPFISSRSGSTDIALDGGGTVDANGDFFYPMRGVVWPEEWRQAPLEQRQRIIHPRLWEPFNSTRVTLYNVTLRNSPDWTIHPFACRGVYIANVTVRNPPTIGHCDGFDPDFSKDVVFEHNDIEVGDDAIAIKSGGCNTTTARPFACGAHQLERRLGYAS